MNFEIPNYTLQKKLGEGAMAEVWLAEHKHNGRKAAIKVLKPVALNDKDAENLFLREGQVLASFDHKNIVKIYDNCRIGDLAFIIMELLPGGTLLERMQRGPIRIDEALGLITQIAGALDAAHKMQVIHRDLKPANVMLRDATTPVLTDFGAVRMLDRSTIYGRDGGVIGTPIYMSPEQITGQPLSGSSDLYALGIMFHELLTGRLPFSGGSIQEVATQHLMAPIPELPVALAMLQPVLEKLLAKKAVDRYADAQEFIDALRHVFLSDEALRRQVGFSGTSMAWSSQLHALGFVLDTVQKDEVRRAQGDFLDTRAAQPNKPVPVPPIPVSVSVPKTELSREPMPLVSVHNPRMSEQLAPIAQPKNSHAVLWFAVMAGLAIAGAGVYRQMPTTTNPAAAEATKKATLVIKTDTTCQLFINGKDRGQLEASTPQRLPVEPGEQLIQCVGADRRVEQTETAEAGRQSVVQLNLPPPARFERVAEGVKDNEQNLIWAERDNGSDINWTNATQYCSGLGSGWTLPNSDALSSMYDANGKYPVPYVYNGTTYNVKPATPLIKVTGQWYWTNEQNGSSGAWGVVLDGGGRYSGAVGYPDARRALCVRRS